MAGMGGVDDSGFGVVCLSLCFCEFRQDADTIVSHHGVNEGVSMGWFAWS